MLTVLTSVLIAAAPPTIPVAVEAEPRWYNGWAVQASLGASGLSHDAYIDRLIAFGFRPKATQFVRYSLGIERRLSDQFSVLSTFDYLERGTFSRDVKLGEPSRSFTWTTRGVAVHIRGRLPLIDGLLTPYLQAGGGLAWSTSTLLNDSAQTGYVLGTAAGLIFTPFRYMGQFLQVGWSSAPVLSNLTGERHNSGGLSVMLGLRGVL